MTTMNTSLTDEMRAFIEARVAQEGYASAGEYILAQVREARKRQTKRDLESKFREALESGPATPMTTEDWDAIRREFRGRHLERRGSTSGQGDAEGR